MEIGAFSNIDHMARLYSAGEYVQECNQERQLRRDCQFVGGEVYFLALLWALNVEFVYRSIVLLYKSINILQGKDLEFDYLEGGQNV